MPLAHNTFSSPPPQQTLHQPPQTATSSHFSGEIYTPSPDTPYSTSVQDASSSSRAASSSYHLPMSSGRRTSDAKASMMKDPSKDSKKGEAAMVKRPEDVFKVVKDRMFCWSYMVQWYQRYVPSSLPSRTHSMQEWNTQMLIAQQRHTLAEHGQDLPINPRDIPRTSPSGQ